MKEKVLYIVALSYVVGIALVLIAPFIITVAQSIDQTHPFYLSYLHIASGFWPALWLSIRIATTVTLLDVIIALPVAYALVRHNLWGRGLINTSLTLVWYMPAASYGFGLILSYYFIYRFLINSFWGIVAAHTNGLLILMLTPIIVNLRQLDPNLEDAAVCLGANRIKAFLMTTLPLLGPGIGAGVLLVFVMSFNEFLTTLFIAGPNYRPASLTLYNDMIQWGFRPSVAAEASIMQLISVVVIIGYMLAVGRRYLKGILFS